VGKPAPERIFMKPEMMSWQWHQLDRLQIISTTFQTGNYPSTSSLWPDAIPDAQPTVSEH